MSTRFAVGILEPVDMVGVEHEDEPFAGDAPGCSRGGDGGDAYSLDAEADDVVIVAEVLGGGAMGIAHHNKPSRPSGRIRDVSPFHVGSMFASRGRVRRHVGSTGSA